MHIQGANSLTGMVISMTSPGFNRNIDHCLTFEYEVTAQQGAPSLEVHVRLTDYMLSGDKIWSSENQAFQHNHANVTVHAADIFQGVPYVLDFVGTLAEPRLTTIRLANIGFSNGQCKWETNSSAGNITGNERHGTINIQLV